MKRLLLVTGDIASGKSTFSRILSARCGAAVFQKDGVKEILGERIPCTDRAENKRLSLAAVDILIHIFSELAPAGVPVILESNFHAEELERLHAAAAANGYEVLTLVLRGDIETIYRRYVHRMRDEDRHPVHLSASLHIRENFVRYVEEARREPVLGAQIAIDATDYAYQTDEALLERIGAFMAGD